MRDMSKLNAFIGQFATDSAAVVRAGMVMIGEKLGARRAAPGIQKVLNDARRRRVSFPSFDPCQ